MFNREKEEKEEKKEDKNELDNNSPAVLSRSVARTRSKSLQNLRASFNSLNDSSASFSSPQTPKKDTVDSNNSQLIRHASSPQFNYDILKEIARARKKLQEPKDKIIDIFKSGFKEISDEELANLAENPENYLAEREEEKLADEKAKLRAKEDEERMKQRGQEDEGKNPEKIKKKKELSLEEIAREEKKQERIKYYSTYQLSQSTSQTIIRIWKELKSHDKELSSLADLIEGIITTLAITKPKHELKMKAHLTKNFMFNLLKGEAKESFNFTRHTLSLMKEQESSFKDNEKLLKHKIILAKDAMLTSKSILPKLKAELEELEYERLDSKLKAVEAKLLKEEEATTSRRSLKF